MGYNISSQLVVAKYITKVKIVIADCEVRFNDFKKIEKLVVRLPQTSV